MIDRNENRGRDENPDRNPTATDRTTDRNPIVADPDRVAPETPGNRDPEGNSETAPNPAPAPKPSIKERLKKAFGWVNGPGRAIAFGVLVLVLVLFGRDIYSSIGVRLQIRDLEKRKTRLEASIASDSALLKNLDDPEFLERYAREHYLLRREGETLYIIED